MKNEIFTPELITLNKNKSPFAKLNDIIAECIEDAIMKLQLAPGSHINVAEIARSFGVSVTPVNSALAQLTSKGVITKKSGSEGYFVYDVSDDEVAELYKYRQCLEGFAAYECTIKAALIDIDQLEVLAERYRQLWTDYANGDTSEANKNARNDADQAFHRLLIESTENNLLIASYNDIQSRANNILLRTLAFWNDVESITSRKQLSLQHLSIVNAIKTGLPEMARQAAEYHVTFAAERFSLYKKYK